MEQGQSAVNAEAVQTGVSKDVAFENLVANVHGFGRDPKTCSDASCGRCGKSTAGVFDGRVRAGDAHDGEGSPAAPPEETYKGSTRFRHDVFSPNDPRVTSGNVDEILAAIEHDPDECAIPDCSVCNKVDASSLQREIKTHTGGGGGSKGPKGKAGTKVCDVVGCYMTMCEHIAEKNSKGYGNESEGKRGPKRKVDGRRNTVAFKVSDAAKAAQQSGAVDGELVDKLMVAVNHGLAYSDVDAFLENAINKPAA